MSFCYALVVLVAMLVLGLIFMQIGLNSAKWAYSHYRDNQALFLAEAAVDRASWMMQSSAVGEDGINTALALTDAEVAAGATRSFTSPVWALDGGSYRFTAVAPHKSLPGTVEIHAVGTAPTGQREDVLVVTKPKPGPTGGTETYIPAACFNYVMFSDHNFTVNGNPSILASTAAGGAGIYANGNVVFSGVASTVEGPICATGRIIGTTTQVPADAGRHEGVARVPMPELDLTYFATRADLTYTGTKVKFNSGHDASIGTYEDPKIIFVNGSAEISGQFTGIGVLVATKGIRVTGNCTYGSPGSSWAFLTSGSFTVAGTAQIHGLVYAHNATGTAEFIGHGTPNIFGGVVADVITLTGSYTTEWDGGPTNIADLPGATHYQGPPVVETVFWERR
jgi:hypothetical protein